MPATPNSLLETFQQLFQQLGFNPAEAAILAIIALVLYDMLWYPYYASYSLLLLPFFAPALSALSALSALALLQNPCRYRCVTGTCRGQRRPPAVPTANAGVALSPSVTSNAAAPQAGAIRFRCSQRPRRGEFCTVKRSPHTPCPVSIRPRCRRDRSRARKPLKAWQMLLAAVAAARAAAEARSRRRQTGRKRDRARSYRCEFLAATDTEDTTIDEPDLSRPAPPAIGVKGSTTLGFSGPMPVATNTSAAGMVEHARGDAGEPVPMLPASWRSNPDHTRE